MQSRLINTAMPLLRLVLPPTFKTSPNMLGELEAFLVCHGFRKTDKWLTPDMAYVVVEFLLMRERRRERRIAREMLAKRDEYADDDTSSDDEDS